MALTEEDLKAIPENGIDPEDPGKYKILLEDLQGNILNGHGRDRSVHLFLQFKPDRTETAKQWIQSFSQRYLKSAQQQFDEAAQYREKNVSGGLFANFFLSCKGYEALGFPGHQIPPDRPFRAGMQHDDIRGFLGDPEVEKWEEGYQNKIHALVLIADDSIDVLAKTVDEITSELNSIADIVHKEDGFILRNKAGQIIEHFGFVDGVSQPLFTKRDILRARTQDPDFSKWDPRSSLDILLVKDSNGKTEDSYGSYLVCRKLEQDVKAFREDQKQLAQTLGIEEDLAGAFIMGRFPDGTPVTESDRALAGSVANNFNYDADLAATKCPFHAHIRKTNPRGDTGRVESSPGLDEALKEEKAHRIARRAVSYGSNDLTQESSSGSGLFFLCFQADIENQFNFMQARWANPKNFVQVNVGPDPVIGQPDGTQKWPKQWGKSETEDYKFTLWVFMKGGEYFFAPSLSFLRSI